MGDAERDTCELTDLTEDSSEGGEGEALRSYVGVDVPELSVDRVPTEDASSPVPSMIFM